MSVREAGTIHPDYPEALPFLPFGTEADANMVRILMGSQGHGELKGELIYTGFINEEHKHWHEATQDERIEAIHPIRGWLTLTIIDLLEDTRKRTEKLNQPR